MRLLELEIANVRGIPNVVLKPSAENFLIWGPNGSGKSAVVDAIDFLLTGRISRLTGKGTAGISLADHGPHIGSKPEAAYVRAQIRIPSYAKPIEIKRSMARPTVLECQKEAKPLLEPVLDVAGRGQHVLTRREILKYITAEAGTRAQEIQDLLNISDVEDIRKAFVKVLGESEREVSAAQAATNQAKGAVNATAQQGSYHPEHILALVNQCRTLLGGEPATQISSAALKTGLTPYSATGGRPGLPNPAVVEKDLQQLRQCLESGFQASVAAHDHELQQVLAEVRADSELLRALDQAELTRLGLGLMDESGKCPLCDVLWDVAKLRDHLERKLLRADKAGEYKRRIDSAAARLLQSATAVASSLTKTISVATSLDEKGDLEDLQQWQGQLQQLVAKLTVPVEQYPSPAPAGVGNMFAPANLEDKLARILTAVHSHCPKASPEQTAWDTLTRFEENLKALETAEGQLRRASLANTRAVILLQRYQAARDNVLGGLYDSIRDRFVELYRKLHGADEQEFAAKLEPDGASLHLEVDFHGRGTHPPHALHSEGHQDSMGLCLYLALSERLTSGIIDLTILDDVVMSVDAEHRRELCTVLATEFKDRQFLITTHDRNWAGQLRSEGVVKSAASIEFFNWNVDTGPQVNHEVDLWDRIESDLTRHDVPAAAAKLRRGSEDYFGKVCDALEAKVLFRLNGRYELGDVLPAAMSRYKDLLGKAKKAAHSWGQNAQMEKVQELDSVAATVFKRTQAEQWAVNSNVHYSQWIDFSPKDFVPVRDAFCDLFDLFRCTGCGSLIRLVSDGPNPVTVRCTCGNHTWNLAEKPKG